MASDTVHHGTILSIHGSGRLGHASIAATWRRAAAAATVAPPRQDACFIVTETCELGHGSTGRDSLGRERTPPVTGCP